MNELEILKELIEFNTVEDKDNSKIVDWISNYLKNSGFKNKVVVNKINGKKILISSIGENHALGFMGHTDTVDKSNNWTYNPFELTKADNNLYGLGVCDMKSGIAAFLKAISDIDKSKLKNGIKIYLTYDEEIGFEGIKELVKNEKEFPKNIIIAEPTNLTPVVATKGCIEYSVTFKGKSAHSSMPHKGINSIYSALSFVNELNLFYKTIKEEKNNLFEVPFTSMNIAKIKGGDAINKIPESCTLEFDFRTIKKEHHEIIKSKISKLLMKYNCEYKIINDVEAMNNKDHKFIKYLEDLTKNKKESFVYVTEASFIKDSNIVLLGVGPVTAHEADEHINYSSLKALIEIYRDIIENKCMGERNEK